MQAFFAMFGIFVSTLCPEKRPGLKPVDPVLGPTTMQEVRVEIRSETALWDWLEAEHARPTGVWLVTFKKAAGAAYVSREAVLDALLAYGWIDGRRKVLDDERTMQWIAPRQVEHWSASYKDRVARLEDEGRMRPSGRAAVERGKASGLWTFMDDVDALIVPDDLRSELGTLGGEKWEALAPSYRRNALRWIKLAKTAPTRGRRIATLAEATAAGRKLPQM